MSNLKLTPQDRQSIDFAEDERLKSLGERGKIIHEKDVAWNILEGEAGTPIIIPMSWDKVKEFCFRILGNDQATFGYKHVAKEFWHNDGTYGVLVEAINEHGSCNGGLVFSISNKSLNSFQLNAVVKNSAMTGFKVGYR